MDDEQAAFRALNETLSRVRPRLRERLEKAAMAIPQFGARANRLTAEEMDERRAHSAAIETAALERGDWEPYLSYLREQGRQFAQLGVTIEQWFSLLAPYREVVVEDAMARLVGDEAAQVLRGLGAFLDRGMATIAETYVQEKQEAVRRVEADLGLYTAMFQKATIGMLVYEWVEPRDRASFKLVAANEAAEQLGRPTLRDDVGKTFDELPRSTTLASPVPDYYVASMTEGKPRRWTIEVERTPGELAGYDAFCFPLGGPHLGVMFENITDRMRQEQRLARSLAELERSNAELDSFAYVASHDLKAPLRDVENLSGWIVEDLGGNLPEATARHVTLLRNRVARMSGLLDDMLSYSRVGRVWEPVERFALGDVIAEAIDLAGLPSSFEVAVSAPPDVMLETPRVPILRVLMNLLTNAAKHHHEPTGRATVEASVDGEQVRIAVSDDGPGIDPRFHERIFAMFQTLRPRDEVEGSGMGLALSLKLVAAHGGTLTVTSALGAGATFTLTWPLHFTPTPAVR